MRTNDLRALYDQRYLVPFSGLTYAAAIERDVVVVRALLPDTKARRLCDLCCGRGGHVVRLSKIPSYTVVGVDLSSSAEEYFRSHHATLHRASFVHATVDDFATSNSDPFDASLCYLPHLDKRCHHNTVSLLRAMCTLSRASLGIISFFCHDYAPLLVGQTVTKYDRESDIMLESQVEYFQKERLLRISQRCSLWKKGVVEEMILYEIGEIEGLLLAAGFPFVTNLNSYRSLAHIASQQRHCEGKATLVAQSDNTSADY